MKKTSIKRLPNITTLRFLLALIVIIFHVPQFCKNRGFAYFDDLPIFHKGLEAVYVFFCLSGFLIIKKLYVEKENTGTIRLINFYRNRILRIFPLYYLVVFIGFVYYNVIVQYFGFNFENEYNLAYGIFLSLTFFANIFASMSPGGILEILWSIAIEEQFYIAIAPTLFLLPLKNMTKFLIGFTVLYFLFFFFGGLEFLRDYQMFYFYFSVGGVASILLEKSWFTAFLRIFRWVIIALLFLYFTTNFFKEHLNDPSYHIISLLLFGLSLAALVLKPIRFFENRTMVYLGSISYGIYMLHAIAMQVVGLLFLKLISPQPIPDIYKIILFFLMTIGLTIILAHFSFKYYEKPFLNKKRK